MKRDLFDILKRDAVGIYNEKELKERLDENKPLKIKLGADPSRPDLHLGHSVILRKLKLFQEHGHEIIFVIGDFTGMIGDPSGKSKARIPLTFEETRENGQTYFDQVTKILDKEKTRIVYNSDWLAHMNFAEVLQLAGKYTVARILERDDFSKRYTSNQPIGIHELFYPLMQGYDSVALNADIEVGGTDQTFNLLVGRVLQKDYGQTPQEVLTFPLLVGLDGKEKMSKSLNNYIGIDEPADVMFEKCMKIPDELMEDYFRLTTDLSENLFQDLIEKDIRQAHFLYAETIVEMYHGKIFVDHAKERYLTVAKGVVPENIPMVKIEKDMMICDVLVMTGLTKSKGEGKRLIQNRGIKIDGQVVEDSKQLVTTSCIISKGKNKFIKIEAI